MAHGWLKARKNQGKAALKMATEYGAELWLEEDVGRDGLEDDVEKTGREMHMGTSKVSSVSLTTTRQESEVCSRRFST